MIFYPEFMFMSVYLKTPRKGSFLAVTLYRGPKYLNFATDFYLNDIFTDFRQNLMAEKYKYQKFRKKS